MGRGRPVGSGAVVREECPRHPDGRVVLNRHYGKASERRQIYRCLPSDGSAPHSFAGVAPRLVGDGSLCSHCENPVAGHEGPRVPRRYEFPVTEAAAALVAIGRGLSYTEAADRARVHRRRDRFDTGARLVGNWIEVLGPVVTGPSSEPAWPETVVLDSAWFMVRNSWTGETTRAFCVLGAYGYPDVGPGRAWALHATPRFQASDWVRFLRSKSRQPKMVVCDNDRSIVAAVKKAWPDTFIKSCEYHLRASALKAITPYGLDTYGNPAMAGLNAAFQNVTSWRRFARSVQGKGVGIEDWVDRHADQVIAQARRRRWLPQHHSTGAIEETLAALREFMAPRAFCYRNAERTNRMLELVRARLNRADDPELYAAAIRA